LFFPAFLALSVCMLVLGKGGPPPFEVVVFSFLAMMTFGWLWEMIGTEVLTITSESLIIRSVFLGLSHAVRYEFGDIKAPHFLARVIGRRGKPSGIVFVCNGKHIKICSGISQPKAKELVAAILCEFPRLAPVWGHYADGVPETGVDGYVSLNLR